MNPASAKTSLNQIPRLHKHFVKMYGKQKSVLDFGAGKIGKVDEFMKSNTKIYLPYDPFNRDGISNQLSLDDVGSVDFILCSNVLNVVEDKILSNVIKVLADLTAKSQAGLCYVTVYHKSSLPKNRTVGNHFQRNEPAKWYLPHLKMHFTTVYLSKNVLSCFN